MKKDTTHSKIITLVEDGLSDIDKVKPIPQTIREFNKLKYEKVKEYGPKDIIRLRRRRLGLSQASFASAINAKLSTVQKWERGVTRPAPYAHRLFQLFDKMGLSLIFSFRPPWIYPQLRVLLSRSLNQPVLLEQRVPVSHHVALLLRLLSTPSMTL